MSKLQDLRMEELYLILGYGKKSPGWQKLDTDVTAHFKSYISRGHVIAQSRTVIDEAMLCASGFLKEEARGEEYWPPLPDCLCWPKDEST